MSRYFGIIITRSDIMTEINKNNILESNLKTLFDAVHWIKTTQNKNFYEACENNFLVKNTIANLCNIHEPLKELIHIPYDKMDSKDFRGYDYCEDLHSSFIKLSLLHVIIIYFDDLILFKLSFISEILPVGKSVLPIVPLNKKSPVNITFSFLLPHLS